MPQQRYHVGIDLGTTFSSLAYVDGEGRVEALRMPDGSFQVASVIYFKSPTSVVIGNEALNFVPLHGERVIQAFRRHMGDPNFHFSVDGKSFRPEELAALILRKLLEPAVAQLGPIEHAVISVPFVFDELRRRATQAAGRIAGLRSVELIDEPVAAALASRHTLSQADGLKRFEDFCADEVVLVCELGAGTFDATVMSLGRDGTFEVKATDGDERLGGEDWDNCLLDLISEEYSRRTSVDPRKDPGFMKEMRVCAANARKSLSERARAEVVINRDGKSVTWHVTRGDFEKKTEPLLLRIEHTLRDLLARHGMDWNHIDRLVLVGDSCQMPMFRRMLERVSGRALAMSLAPNTAIAKGAGLQAACRSRKQNSIIKEAPTVHSAPLEPSPSTRPAPEDAVPILFCCPACQAKLRVKAERAGKRAKCPRCGHITPVPASAPAVAGPAASPKHSEPAVTCADNADAAKVNELTYPPLKELLQEVREGQPAQIAFADQPAAFERRVRLLEAWAGTGKMPGVTVVVLDACNPRASHDRLLLRTGHRNEYVKFYNESGSTELLRRLLPGKTWADLQGTALSNCDLPGSKLASAEPFNRLLREIEEGCYSFRSVITPRRAMRRLEYKNTCDRCGDDVLTVRELVLLARATGLDVADDRVVASAAAKARALALENRKGFQCESCLLPGGKFQSRMFCQECLLAAVPHAGPLPQTCPDCGKTVAPSVGGRCGGLGLHCPDCGRVVHRLQDYYDELGTSMQYSDPGGYCSAETNLEQQARIAELADHFFDLGADSFKYPVILTSAWSAPLEKSADGTITGGGWKELNEALCHNKQSNQEAILVCVTREKALAAPSRALREGNRLAQLVGNAGEVRAVLLALALRSEYALTGSKSDRSSFGVDFSSRLAECRSDVLRCGNLLRALALRPVIEQFGSAWQPTGALRKLILRESADLARVLLTNHCKAYDFNLVRANPA